MHAGQSVTERRSEAVSLVLGVDTCGPTGSVALARLAGGKLEILGQTELEGRTYSATLVAAVAELLDRAKMRVGMLHAMVVVNGPGSFTGVRVGLSAVKGLAEPGEIPVVALSRLAVLASKAGERSSAIDAHRHQVFLRVMRTDGESSELLAGAMELGAIESHPARIAICDEGAATLLGMNWESSALVRVGAPTAADALELAVPGILAGRFIDLALLDGHYLRRSDAEIFGELAAATAHSA
jgi:tRNA threonylcarbamoyladenosine biosynthesis protein TsaB